MMLNIPAWECFEGCWRPPRIVHGVSMKVAMEMKSPMNPEQFRQLVNSNEAVSFEGMDRKEV